MDRPPPQHEHGTQRAATNQPALSKQDFERIAMMRYALRRLSRQTELRARQAGLSPQQYQLLLAIKGFPGRDWANITELAERLQVRHNAVIGLVNRAEERGLILRRHDVAADRRVAQISLTPFGEEALQLLAASLRDERQHLRLALEALPG